MSSDTYGEMFDDFERRPRNWFYEVLLSGKACVLFDVGKTERGTTYRSIFYVRKGANAIFLVPREKLHKKEHVWRQIKDWLELLRNKLLSKREKKALKYAWRRLPV